MPINANDLVPGQILEVTEPDGSYALFSIRGVRFQIESVDANNRIKVCNVDGSRVTEPSFSSMSLEWLRENVNNLVVTARPFYPANEHLLAALSVVPPWPEGAVLRHRAGTNPFLTQYCDLRTLPRYVFSTYHLSVSPSWALRAPQGDLFFCVQSYLLPAAAALLEPISPEPESDDLALTVSLPEQESVPGIFFFTETEDAELNILRWIQCQVYNHGTRFIIDTESDNSDECGYRTINHLWAGRPSRGSLGATTSTYPSNGRVLFLCFRDFTARDGNVIEAGDVIAGPTDKLGIPDPRDSLSITNLFNAEHNQEPFKEAVRQRFSSVIAPDPSPPVEIESQPPGMTYDPRGVFFRFSSHEMEQRYCEWLAEELYDRTGHASLLLQAAANPAEYEVSSPLVEGRNFEGRWQPTWLFLSFENAPGRWGGHKGNVYQVPLAGAPSPREGLWWRDLVLPTQEDEMFALIQRNFPHRNENTAAVGHETQPEVDADDLEGVDYLQFNWAGSENRNPRAVTEFEEWLKAVNPEIFFLGGNPHFLAPGMSLYLFYKTNGVFSAGRLFYDCSSRKTFDKNRKIKVFTLPEQMVQARIAVLRRFACGQKPIGVENLTAVHQPKTLPYVRHGCRALPDRFPWVAPSIKDWGIERDPDEIRRQDY